MTKSSVDRYFLILSVVISVLVYASTDDFPGIAQKTSAVYVRFLAVCFGTLSVIQLVLNIFKRDKSERMDLADHLPRFFGLLSALIIFALFFESLGFFIAAGIFIPVIAYLLGERNTILIALTTIGILSGVYLIFVSVLSVNLPGPRLW